MKHMLHGMLGALALTLSVSAPLFAEETVTECQERVIEDCAQALEKSNWFEDIAIGVICTGRLVGCGTVNVVLKLT